MNKQQVQKVNLAIVFLLLTYCLSFIKCTSPAYFFQTTYKSSGGDRPLSLNQLNLDTNTVSLISHTTSEEYPSTFYGEVVYYKTGILYANYWSPLGNDNYQSLLLAIDTLTGNILFKDFPFCEGLVTSGLAIDQTNGDIHFLNQTTQTVSVTERTSVDWSKWNIESNITTVVQYKANESTGPYGQIVFNSLTDTLIYLNISIDFLQLYQANSPMKTITLPIQWYFMTINSKTGDLYSATIVYNQPNNYQELSIVKIIEDGSGINSTLLCQYNVDGFNYLGAGCDYDYVGNSWIAGFPQTYDLNGGPYNLFYHLNIDTCVGEYFNQSIDPNKYRQGIPRFNSGYPSN